MSAGNKDKLDSGDLERTISGNEETLSDDHSVCCDYTVFIDMLIYMFIDNMFFQNGEENVTKIVNMETSQDDNVKELKSQDCELYGILKEKSEKQQMIIDIQQTHTEVYTYMASCFLQDFVFGDS